MDVQNRKVIGIVARQIEFGTVGAQVAGAVGTALGDAHQLEIVVDVHLRDLLDESLLQQVPAAPHRAHTDDAQIAGLDQIPVHLGQQRFNHARQQHTGLMEERQGQLVAGFRILGELLAQIGKEGLVEFGIAMRQHIVACLYAKMLADERPGLLDGLRRLLQVIHVVEDQLDGPI